MSVPTQQQFVSPTVSGGHYDQILTNVSVAFMQRAENFVARQIFPVVPVAKASDVYFKYPRGYFWRDLLGPRPIGGYPRQVDYKIETEHYSIEEFALETFLDDRQRANATPPHNPERKKVELLTSQAMIHRDVQWRNQFFRPGVWTHDISGVSSSPDALEVLQWNEANSDPIADIDLYREHMAESTALEPNVLVLGRRAYRALKNHPDIRDRYKYTQGGQLTRDILGSIFEVDRVVIPSGVVNEGSEMVDPSDEAADDFNFIFPSTSALLVYAAPSPGLDQASAGYIFSWTGLLGSAALEAGIWRGREERAHSDWFQIRVAYDMHMVSPDLGIFFNNVVA